MLVQTLVLALLSVSAPDTSKYLELPPVPQLHMPGTIDEHEDAPTCLTPEQYRGLRLYLSEWDDYPRLAGAHLTELDRFWRRVLESEQKRAHVSEGATRAEGEAQVAAWKNKLLWASVGAGAILLLGGGATAGWYYTLGPGAQ